MGLPLPLGCGDLLGKLIDLNAKLIDGLGELAYCGFCAISATAEDFDDKRKVVGTAALNFRDMEGRAGRPAPTCASADTGHRKRPATITSYRCPFSSLVPLLMMASKRRMEKSTVCSAARRLI